MNRPEEERRESLAKWGFTGWHMNARLAKAMPPSQPNMEIQIVEYHDMLRDPVGTLNATGWPIKDYEAAADVVDLALYRHRNGQIELPADR